MTHHSTPSALTPRSPGTGMFPVLAAARSAGLHPRANPPRRPASRFSLRNAMADGYGAIGSARSFQAPSMAFSAGLPWPAAYFSLLVQREVGKRKDPPGGAPSAHPALRVRERARASAVARPCAIAPVGAIHRADPRALPGDGSGPARRASWGPVQAAAFPGRRSASAHRSAESMPVVSVCRAGRMPALFWGPRTARRAADGNVAGHRPAIAAMDRGDRSDGTWMCHRGGPAAARVPGGQDARRARRWGALLFGYFLLGKQEKVTRGPGMARGKSQGRRLKRAMRTNLAAARAPTGHGWPHLKPGVATGWAGMQPRDAAIGTRGSGGAGSNPAQRNSTGRSDATSAVGAGGGA
jgi:hypothetical protein